MQTYVYVKLKEGRFKPDITITFFRIRMVKHWNRLFRGVVAALSLEFEGQAE